MSKLLPVDGLRIEEQREETANYLFPVFLKLQQLHLLIIGGGKVALEKLNAVLQNAPECTITLVAITVSEDVKAIADRYPYISYEERAYNKSDLEGKDLAIVAIDDKEKSLTIFNDAREARLLINIADTPQYCDFYLGSIVNKGHLKIGISTNGKSPTIAKRLKEVLQDTLPDFDNLLDNMQRLRAEFKGDFSRKVNYLNRVTRGLVHKKKWYRSSGEQKWKTVAYWFLIPFFFLFAGNLISEYITVQDIGNGLAWVHDTMGRQFYWMILAGFLAQLVDGALGMGYGVTCTSVLLYIGIPLPAISSSIHTAEMFSSGASGLSHYKFGNINKKLFGLLVVPGVIGAIGGAWLLATFGEEYASLFRPLLAAYTLFLGTRILLNAFRKRVRKEKLKHVGWLAGAGGFLDSFGGGGWGPLVTSTLISKGKTPKYVIGTVSLTEFFVTLASTFTFFSVIGISHWQVIAGLVVGGMLGAPLAARLAGRLPVKTMFIAVGCMIILWSINILIRTLI